MKLLFVAVAICAGITTSGQSLQWHYDFRHSLYPKLNAVNFPTFTFEYFKNLDSAKGSFLIKVQTDLSGKSNNVGQVFTQITRTLRFWKPPVQLALSYSGGLGVAPASFGFYISNAFAAGASYPFQWKGAYLVTNLQLRYNAFDAPSYDPQFTFYFGKGYNNYKLFVTASFTFWTQNRNQGNVATQDLTGKVFEFFGDPQLWYRVYKGVSIGTRIYVYYHVLSGDNQVQFYPTIGIKNQF